MCHQTILAFVKCRHSAQVLTICNKIETDPPQLCLTAWEGNFIQSDTICRGCHEVFVLQGDNGGDSIPKDVKGIYKDMPVLYVICGQLPWGQSSSCGSQGILGEGVFVCRSGDERASWMKQFLETSLSETIYEEREKSSDSKPHAKSTPIVSSIKPPASPPCNSHLWTTQDTRYNPEAEETISSTQTYKPQVSSTEKSYGKFKSRKQVRLSLTPEVQYFAQDIATCSIKRGTGV